MLRRAVFLLLGLSIAVLVYGRNSSAQSISIFGEAVPTDPTGAGKTVTMGVKFWSSKSGTISAIRFYRAAVSSNGYVASLYSAGGTLLGSATLAHESGPVPGWQVANFASPITVSANTTYISAYYCPVGQGAGDPNELKNGVMNGPLTAPASSAVGGNGVYNSKNGFPKSSQQASNYYVDVLFTPTGPSLVLSFNPPNPSIPANASLGSVVAAPGLPYCPGRLMHFVCRFGTKYTLVHGARTPSDISPSSSRSTPPAAFVGQMHLPNLFALAGTVGVYPLPGLHRPR
jgi:hypothetical protein